MTEVKAHWFLVLCSLVAVFSTVNAHECPVCEKVVKRALRKMPKHLRTKPQALQKGIEDFCNPNYRAYMNITVDYGEKEVCDMIINMQGALSIANPIAFKRGGALLGCQTLDERTRGKSDLCKAEFKPLDLKSLTDRDFYRMQIRKLSKILKRYGLKCSADCSRADYIRMIKEDIIAKLDEGKRPGNSSEEQLDKTNINLAVGEAAAEEQRGDESVEVKPPAPKVDSKLLDEVKQFRQEL